MQIDPNANNPKDTNNNPNRMQDDKFTAFIREAFRNCSTENRGVLTKDNFNQVLAVLENLGFKRLRDTPLADRLFQLLDKVHQIDYP